MRRLYATFVLPAPSGCNLNCLFCIVAQRREAEQSVLTDEDYVRFLTDMMVNLPVTRFSIQGYEPLLPETWPLTKKLLRIGGAFFAETSFVTNGTYLAEHAEEIGRFPGLTDRITVSLDSDSPTRHDKLRGKVGSHEDAVRGIQALTRVFHGTLTVNSVLFPGKGEFLTGMPALLESLGVREWAISPLIEVGKEEKLREAVQVKQDLLWLSGQAKLRGINVFLSDELRSLEGNDLYKDFYIRSLGVEEEIFRLAPDGSCSRGMELLNESGAAPKWSREEAPSHFLQRIFRGTGQELETRGSFARGLLGLHARRVIRRLERR